MKLIKQQSSNTLPREADDHTDITTKPPHAHRSHPTLAGLRRRHESMLLPVQPPAHVMFWETSLESSLNYKQPARKHVSHLQGRVLL
jgi:hypothetical protein